MTVEMCLSTFRMAAQWGTSDAGTFGRRSLSPHCCCVRVIGCESKLNDKSRTRPINAVFEPSSMRLVLPQSMLSLIDLWRKTTAAMVRQKIIFRN